MIVITSRDPAAPGLDYLNAAGGFLEIQRYMILIYQDLFWGMTP